MTSKKGKLLFDKAAKITAAAATAILILSAFFGFAIGHVADQQGGTGSSGISQVEAAAFYSNHVLTLKNQKGTDVITYNANGYSGTYTVNGVTTYIALINLPNGSIKYSINNGPYMFFRSHNLAKSNAGSSNSAEPAVSYSPDANEWFDSVYFDYGYPHVYSHPDLAYYGMYAKYNYAIWGKELLHYMFGWGYIDSLGILGTAVIGAAIGAVIGGEAGSLWGAVAGAVIGAVLGAVLPTILKDNAQDIWWWINNGLITALQHAPWWAYLPGGEQYYFFQNFHFLRIGGSTIYNQMGINFP